MMIRALISKRFDKWLSKRMPAAKEVRLNSGNTFIFPSKTGFQFLISCFVLFLLGTNYQNNLILFLVFFLCSFMVTSLLLSYRNLAGLSLRGIDPSPQFANNDCCFKIKIKQKQTARHDIDFLFQHPSSALKSVINDNMVSIYAHNALRGYFKPGRVTVRSNYPFGLYNVWTHLDFDFKVLLYPQILENDNQLIRSSNKTHENFSHHSKTGIDQFSTLKNYQLGESLKSVAWKQLAQGRGWLTKQFEESAGGDIFLDINSFRHLPLETRLSYLCYQIIELNKSNQRYSLSLDDNYFEPDVGSIQKEKCLRALALYSIYPANYESQTEKNANRKPSKTSSTSVKSSYKVGDKT